MDQDGPLAGPKILCIDDDWSLLRVLRVKLQVHGFVPLTASDGPTGLALAAAARPALVVVDLMMPGLDGFEVCRQLRADPRTRDIPLIVLTGVGGATAEQWALQAGANQVLSKPFAPEQLLATLRHALAPADGASGA
jgi:CheY-like chemotaxis protein